MYDRFISKAKKEKDDFIRSTQDLINKINFVHKYSTHEIEDLQIKLFKKNNFFKPE